MVQRTRPLTSARSAQLREKFKTVRVRFTDAEVGRALDRATTHEHATCQFTVRNKRLLDAARRHAGPRVSVVSRTYPEHDTIVYWLEAR